MLVNIALPNGTVIQREFKMKNRYKGGGYESDYQETLDPPIDSREIELRIRRRWIGIRLILK